MDTDLGHSNVFITSFGRTVSPDEVEAELTDGRAIARAAVFGEARPFNVAVLVPASADVRREDLERDVAAANRRLPGYAQVCRWFVAATPFTVANGLLTADGRNRRAAIWNAYRWQIDACYYERVVGYA